MKLTLTIALTFIVSVGMAQTTRITSGHLFRPIEKEVMSRITTVEVQSQLKSRIANYMPLKMDIVNSTFTELNKVDWQKPPLRYVAKYQSALNKKWWVTEMVVDKKGQMQSIRVISLDYYNSLYPIVNP